MTRLEPCSALTVIDGKDRCRNGFWTTAVCAGISAETVTPTCCDEDRCAHLYEFNGGRPPDHMLLPRTPEGTES